MQAFFRSRIPLAILEEPLQKGVCKSISIVSPITFAFSISLDGFALFTPDLTGLWCSGVKTEIGGQVVGCKDGENTRLEVRRNDAGFFRASLISLRAVVGEILFRVGGFGL